MTAKSEAPELLSSEELDAVSGGWFCVCAGFRAPSSGETGQGGQNDPAQMFQQILQQLTQGGYAPQANLPTMGSSLVRRLVWARNDPGKERVRARLMDLDDGQLSSGLGLTPEDIAVLRGGTPRAYPATALRRAA